MVVIFEGMTGLCVQIQTGSASGVSRRLEMSGWKGKAVQSTGGIIKAHRSEGEMKLDECLDVYLLAVASFLMTQNAILPHIFNEQTPSTANSDMTVRFFAITTVTMSFVSLQFYKLLNRDLMVLFVALNHSIT